MTIPETSVSFAQTNVLIFVTAITMMFAATIVTLTIHDYRLYLQENWQKRYSFTDFIKREQFYIFLLLSFVALFSVDMWLHQLP